MLMLEFLKQRRLLCADLKAGVLGISGTSGDGRDAGQAEELSASPLVTLADPQVT